MRERIEQARHDPAALEALYRGSRAAGEESEFSEAIGALARSNPKDVLLDAWTYRLDVKALQAPEAIQEDVAPRLGWPVAILISALLGLVYVALTWNTVSVPLSESGAQLFAIGWTPVTGLAILLFAAVAGGTRARFRYYLAAGGTVVVLTAFAYWAGRLPVRVAGGIPASTADAKALLVYIHLPFLVWSVLACAFVLGRADVWRQLHAFVIKSAEVVVTAGVYAIGGAVFFGLTVGIFSALGVTLPGHWVARLAAWGAGAIPVLALASVYDPAREPVLQIWSTGLARILRTLVRLLLPLTAAVLLVYVAWFIPVYFMRAFQQRETLIVYNVSIVAIIAVLACAVPGLDERPSALYGLALRWGLVAIAVMTLLLNAYALAAIVSRTVATGLSPNRHAVIGWNVVTLLILGSVLVRQLLLRRKEWSEVFRRSVAQSLLLAAAWSLWVVAGLPHL